MRLVLAVLWTAGTPPARTQILTNPTSAITAFTVSDPSVSETRIVLSFSPSVPTFSIVANDAATATIAFSDARLAPGVVIPAGPHGVIETMRIMEGYGVLTLILTSAGSLHVATQASVGGGVAISVTASKGAPAAPSTTVPSPAMLPPTQQAGSYGVAEAFEVVPLKYADVSEIVGLLTSNQSVKPNDDFTPQEPSFGSASLQGYYGSGTIPTTPVSGIPSTFGPSNEPLGRSIDDSIGIDRRLNAIILKGPAIRVAALKAEIAKLDVPVTSVLLETVFVELSQTGARNVGIDFSNANNQLATASYSFTAGGFPGVADSGHRGGVSVNLQAAIYAQIAKGEGHIVSKPRISAQSGQTAKIVTGDALPILTSIALSGVNAVQQQVQYVNVGVTLQIAPRVTDDGFVTSHIYSVVSSVTGYSQGYPTISQREATTSATVKDGDSFIIGGLTQESSLLLRNKIPVLGQIPLVGALFRSAHDSSTKTELYVIITPHVVRSTAVAPEANGR